MDNSPDLDSRRESLSDVKRALLHKLRRARGDGVSKSEIPVSSESASPPSSMQEGLWFLMQANADCSAYNISLAYRLRGELDPALLEQSLNDVVARHDILRTSLDVVDESPTLVVHEDLEVRFVQKDLQSLEGPDQDREVLARMDSIASTPIDLRTDPGPRATLLRLAADVPKGVHACCDYSTRPRGDEGG